MARNKERATEFITEDNLSNIFAKTAPTRADTIQGGDADTVRTW